MVENHNGFLDKVHDSWYNVREREVNSVSFGDILKCLRKEAHMTQDELAQTLNVAKSTVSMYERGERFPGFEAVQEIADVFGIHTDVLYGREELAHGEAASGQENSPPHPGLNLQKFAASASRGPEGRIPLLGYVTEFSAGEIPDRGEGEEIPVEMVQDGEYVALRIRGTSMEPRMLDGDVVIVRIQTSVESGETAIVSVGGDQAICRRVKKTPYGIMLIPNNPACEPMFYTEKQMEELPVRILGKVVELRAKFR